MAGVVFNQGFCFNCASPTSDFDYVGHTRVYVCDDNECLRALEVAQKEEDDYRREDEYLERIERGWGW